MRGIRRFLGLILVVVWISPMRAGGTSWTGKDIIMKRNGVQIGHTDAQGEQAYLAKLTQISYRVLEDKGGWLKVRAGKHEGWFDKDEAVLVGDANAFFSARLRNEPRNDQYYARRGEAWSILGEHDKAASDYAEAIRLRPYEIDWHINRGIILRDKGDHDGAIRDFTQAIQLDPSAAGAYHNRGWTYSMKKEYDKAISDCNESLRLNPTNNYLALNRRGIAYLGLGDLDWALADFDEVLRINPNHVYAYFNRAKVWVLKNEPAKAVREYELSFKVDSQRAESYNSLAWLLATCFDEKVRDGKRAVELANRACELSKFQVMSHLDTLAAAYAESGQFAEAVKWQQKALENEEYAKRYGEKAKERLRLYQEQKAYTAARESPPTSTASRAGPEAPATPVISSGLLKGWVEFTSAEGKFSVSLPRVPKLVKQSVGSIENFTYLVESDDGRIYGVSYFDTPAQVVISLDAVIQNFIKGSKGTIVSDKRIALDEEFPGRDVLIRYANRAGHARFFAVGRRFFMLVLDGPEEFVNSKTGNAMLDSFRRVSK